MNYYSYLFSLFLFKLAVGAILLATSWDALTLSQDSVLNVSLLMALNFIPAAFARPIFNKFNTLSVHRILAISFLVSAILIMAELFLILEKSYQVFVVNFMLWIFIFIIEVSYEKWYVTLSQDDTLLNVRKQSGVSTSIAQLGVILGPVMVLVVNTYSHLLVYWIISCTLILASITSSLDSGKKLNNLVSAQAAMESVKSDYNDKRFMYILAFALIWPTLAIFNISAPVLSKLEYHTIKVAGTMEVLIGLATALTGFIHPIATKFLTHQKRIIYIFCIITLFTELIYFYPKVLFIVLMATFFTGLTFGYLRIELRTFLARRYTPKAAGEIIAAANSWSVPFVLVYCTIYYFNARSGIQHGITLLFPASFIIATVVFCILLLSDTGCQEETY